MKSFLLAFIKTTLLTYFLYLGGLAASYALDDKPLPTSEQLNFYSEIYPPSTFYQENKLVGISVETLALIWKKLNHEPQQVYIVPWARAYHSLQQDPNAVLFAMSRNNDREHLFQWAGPIFTAHYVIVAKKDFPKEKTSEAQLFNNSFALIRDDITELLLRKHGVTSLVESRDMNHAERLFANNRIDLLAISITGLEQVYKLAPEKRHQYKVITKLGEVSDYFAFNKQVPKEVVKQYQQAINELQTEINALKQKYGFIESYR